MTSNSSWINNSVEHSLNEIFEKLNYVTYTKLNQFTRTRKIMSRFNGTTIMSFILFHNMLRSIFWYKTKHFFVRCHIKDMTHHMKIFLKLSFSCITLQYKIIILFIESQQKLKSPNKHKHPLQIPMSNLNLTKEKNINWLCFPNKFHSNVQLKHTYLLLLVFPTCITLFVYALTIFSLCWINHVAFT